MRLTDRSDALFYAVKSISDKSFDGDERPNEATLRYTFDHCELFVGTSKIVGFIIAFAIVVTQGSQPYLWSIAVDPKYRKCGVATELLREVIDFYRTGAGDNQYPSKIDLTVHVDNPSQKLYFDHEFRVTQVVKNYYGDKSGLRMRRSL